MVDQIFILSYNTCMIYFAYGMNTNREEMHHRCRGALSLGPAQLLGHSFRFAHHADVVPCEHSHVEGVAWRIDQYHLQALDRLEGYPWYYDRVQATICLRDRQLQAWVYRMQPGNDPALPSQHYYDTVMEGYQVHGVPTDQLLNAVLL